MARLRRGTAEALNVWPGYVDALSTLLMVIIFVLLVFVLAQAFLSVTLSGRNQQVDLLHRQLTELSEQLAAARGQSAKLEDSAARATRALVATAAERTDLAQRLAALGAQQGQAATRYAADLGRLRDDLAAARQQLDAMRQQAEAADREVQAGRATVAAKLSDLASLAQQVQSLTALRDQLQREAEQANARAAAEAAQHATLAAQLDETQKSADAGAARIAQLSQDLAALRAQMAAAQAALQNSDSAGRDKDAQIGDLGRRLDTALAQRVEELQRYRSEFFGRLRSVLANRPGVQVVGDRFVFQSEVLFVSGGISLDPAGQEQIGKLAATLRDLSRDIPPDVNWVLRVDGHADHLPVDPFGPFVDNWDLSAKRATNVAKLLIAEGIPANRIAVTAFADNQPLDPGSTPEAYKKNRRIEIRLTDR